jgi:hypothetical protein
VIAALAYVSLGSSIVAFRCWGLGVAEGGPALAAFFNNLTPLFAALLSTLLLGEAPSPTTRWLSPASWAASPSAHGDHAEAGAAVRCASVQPDCRIEVPGPAQLDDVVLARQTRRKGLIRRLRLHDAPDRLVDLDYPAGDHEGH